MYIDEVNDVLSVCSVEQFEQFDSQILTRRADIINGEIISPIISDDEPKIFGNRLNIYKKDGPMIEGYIGVWRWSAKHNINDYEKDYVSSNFEPSIVPIEAIEIKNDYWYDSKSIIERIQSGLEIDKPNGNIMLIRNIDLNNVEAIYLSKQDIVEKNGKYTITEDAVKLPFYKFTNNDFFEIKEKKFYKKIYLDKTPDYYHNVKEPIEIVKSIILDSVNWQSLKSQGYSREQYKKIKEYIQSIDRDSIAKKISEKLDCSESTAKNHYENFVRKCANHLDGVSELDTILLDLLERNEKAKNECEKAIKHKWEEKNKSLIDEANKHLEEIIDKSTEIRNDVEKLECSLKSKENELLLLEEEANKYISLGEEVKESVAQKISDAKENIASFIGEVEFIKSITSTNKELDVVGNTNIVTSKIGCELESELIVNNTWKDLLYNLMCELEDVVGIQEECSDELATLIYSCYYNRFPMLIAGPNAYDIATAFSATLEHKTPFTIECRENHMFPKNINPNTETVVIKYPFVNGVREDVLEMIKDEEHFYILCCPYHEDLIIEPKGIFNYMLPVVSDYFVESKATGKFEGSIKAEGFRDFEQNDERKIKSYKYFRKIGFSMYLANNCDLILQDCTAMGIKDPDFIFKYILLSLATVTGTEEKVNQIVQKSLKVSNELKDYFNSLFGEL